MATSTHLLVATDEARDLRSTLRALTAELGGAEAMALALQESIGGVVTRLPEPCPEVYELQAIDRLAQTLGDLARFIGAIADAVPESWHVEAAHAALALHQRDLASRLAERDAVATAADSCDEDFRLFRG